MGFNDWLKEFVSDSEDFFTDDIPEAFQKYILDELVKDSIKYERLKFQAFAVKAINVGEEAAIVAAQTELASLGLELTAAQEAVLRKVYWTPFDLIKKATGIDWLVDT